MESTMASWAFGGTLIRPASSDAWECVLAWWLSLAGCLVHSQNGKREGKRKASLLETTKHAKKCVLPFAVVGRKFCEM